MENEEMDVFARACLFLAETTYKRFGIDAVVKIVPADNGGQENGGVLSWLSGTKNTEARPKRKS